VSNGGLGQECDSPIIGIDAEALTIVKGLGGFAGADDGGEAEFASDDRGMGERTAVIGDDGAEFGEEDGECGVGGAGDEDVADLDLVEVFGTADDSGGALEVTGRGDDALKDIRLGGLWSDRAVHLGLNRHGAVDEVGRIREPVRRDWEAVGLAELGGNISDGVGCPVEISIREFVGARAAGITRGGTLE
jgi:hypothetical protein